MLGTKTLFTYSENGEDESLADYGLNFSSSGLANTFYMNFYTTVLHYVHVLCHLVPK